MTEPLGLIHFKKYIYTYSFNKKWVIINNRYQQLFLRLTPIQVGTYQAKIQS